VLWLPVLQARQLESLVRLAEARARVELRQVVTRADAEVRARSNLHFRTAIPPRGVARCARFLCHWSHARVRMRGHTTALLCVHVSRCVPCAHLLGAKEVRGRGSSNMLPPF